MNEKKVEKYLKNKGIECDWNLQDFKNIMNDLALDWEGEKTGFLIFNKSKSGRRYIKFESSRCFID